MRAQVTPIVSVVVPVWNVEPYLRECLDSILAQTIGPDAIEIVAVDDGSTDGGGAILDEYAAAHDNFVVRHEPNSGGPGRPRNQGIDLAHGRYIFFLDADDYLGEEALERAVAMAERAGSDIVLVQVASVAGRKVRRDAGMGDRSIERARIEEVYHSGNVHKLFRREFLERSGDRFTEGVAGGEDGDLMAALYERAGTISVVGGYDAYYLRRRPGSQTQRRDSPDDLIAYLRRIEAKRIAVVAANRSRGWSRDVLMRRHFRKIARLFGPSWLRYDAADRRRTFSVGSEIIGRWHTERIERLLPAWASLRVHCLRRGRLTELEDIVGTPPAEAFGAPRREGRRLFARLPHFRDDSGIPDGCFDITDELRPSMRLTRAAVIDGRLELAGQAFLELVGGRTTIEVHRWPLGPSRALAVRALPTPLLRDAAAAYPMAGFEAHLEIEPEDGSRLPDGIWSISATIGTPTVRRQGAIRASGALLRGTRDRGAGTVAGARLVLGPGRELRLRVGRRRTVIEWLEGVATRVRRASYLATRVWRLTRRAF